MPLTVLYFAAARDAVGAAREPLDPVPATVGDLRRRLRERCPALGPVLARSRIAVDGEFADDDAALRDGAEVAVIPPVAGGGPACAVVERPIRLDEVVEAVSSPALGGLVTFTGVVRDASAGRRVERLEYQAYLGMAERALARIAEEVGRGHGCRVSIVHRIGVLVPGDAAVVVACAAPHRAQAFRGCEEAMERLKREVPIWKREVYQDGSQWVGMTP
jgi:molybdopterin synthase catalytic subunit/molybdopterin converting factor small subunit